MNQTNSLAELTAWVGPRGRDRCYSKEADINKVTKYKWARTLEGRPIGRQDCVMGGAHSGRGVKQALPASETGVKGVSDQPALPLPPSLPLYLAVGAGPGSCPPEGPLPAKSPSVPKAFHSQTPAAIPPSGSAWSSAWQPGVDRKETLPGHRHLPPPDLGPNALPEGLLRTQ